MDEAQVRQAMETALAEHAPGFGSFFLARLLGLEISYPGETCLVAFAVHGWMHNPQGTLHGGVIATVMDISMGHLLHHAAMPGMTLEMKTQYFAPIRSGRAEARGSFLRRGRSICFLESRLTDGAGELCALATATWRLPPPPRTQA